MSARCLKIEAALLLLLAWVMLRILPFRWVAEFIRPKLGTVSTLPASQIAQAIRATARRVPFPAMCFAQGIATQWMLCRRGIPATLRYGVRKATHAEIPAHVWVTVNDSIVIGGEVAKDYTLLASFPPKAP